jgi:hypothetical protein
VLWVPEAVQRQCRGGGAENKEWQEQSRRRGAGEVERVSTFDYAGDCAGAEVLQSAEVH